ncbi:MAG: asparagine synthase (glutamine-hydrolyzing) [Candidatus Scalindua sp.]
MCGLSGFCDFRGLDPSAEQVCLTMASKLIHRGPDDKGVWVNREHGVALGHRRLSIQDLSSSGHQPMESSSGRYVVTYNGEIYNFLDLQTELAGLGYKFRGHSDTEVLLASVETWGLADALTRFTGMFAIALWDKNQRVLSLTRDRIGEKPLYYGWQGGSFLFGSELKALRVHPDWQNKINRNALALYMRHNYIPTPYSIYQGIHKLTPGTLLHIPHTLQPGVLPAPVPYWNMKDVSEYGAMNPVNLPENEAIDALDGLLRKSIRNKMISDVPLGAFLSGGYDSSAVVALMQAESAQQIKTFSIGFHEEAYNEADHAKRVASHLGTEHTELYVTPEQAMDVIPRLPYLYDEPFSDSSQIPTFLVSEMTRQYVTVSLSGDGGDELFAGYERYFFANALWKKAGRVPYPLRRALSSIIKGINPAVLSALMQPFSPRLSSFGGQGSLGDKLHKGADLLMFRGFEELYFRLISHWNDTTNLVLGSEEPLTLLTVSAQRAKLPDNMQRMQYLDTISYLPDDILVKVDRAAMGVSLETRVPFLDHKVVEYAWSLPQNLKVRNGEGKWILRKLLDKYIPGKLMDRPKMGFGVPIDSWLRGPLRDWAEELLNENRLRDEGFFNPSPIRKKLAEHMSGDRNWQHHLWDVLMFESWLESLG